MNFETFTVIECNEVDVTPTSDVAGKMVSEK
jgi:hypothetical protein